MKNNLSALEIKKILEKARKYPVIGLPDPIISSDRLINGLLFVQGLGCDLLNQEATVFAMRQNRYSPEARNLSGMSNSQYKIFLETQFSKQSKRVPV